MTEITREVWIDAPKQQVWNALADFGNVYQMSPGILKSYLTSDQKTGVGASRHCDLALFGASVEERISEWDEGNKIEIEIYEANKLPMVKDLVADFTLQMERGGTRLRGTFSYGMKYGPVGALMNTLTLKSQNDKGLSAFMAGIKRYVETGEQIDSPKGLDFEAVVVA